MRKGDVFVVQPAAAFTLPVANHFTDKVAKMMPEALHKGVVLIRPQANMKVKLQMRDDATALIDH